MPFDFAQDQFSGYVLAMSKPAISGGHVELVAGPGVEPGLEDYEPSVQPYTTPHVNERSNDTSFEAKWQG